MLWLRAVAYTGLFFLWTGFLCIAGLPWLLLPPAATGRFARFWLRTSLAMLAGLVGLRHVVRGRDRLPDGPMILAVKHQSTWETLALSLLFPNPAFVLKAELYRIPFFGWFLRRSSHIGVDRSAGAAALRSMMREAQQVAAAGRSIVIFPQGTRVAPGVPVAAAPYQPGVYALYAQLKIPVVPIALNSGLFWGRRSFLKRPGTIVVEILPAIAPGLPRPEFMGELETRIETATARLEAEARGAAPLA